MSEVPSSEEYTDELWEEVQKNLNLMKEFGTTDPVKIERINQIRARRKERLKLSQEKLLEVKFGYSLIVKQLMPCWIILKRYFNNRGDEEFHLVSELHQLLYVLYVELYPEDVFPIQTPHGLGNHIKKSFDYYKNELNLEIKTDYNYVSRRYTYAIKFNGDKDDS